MMSGLAGASPLDWATAAVDAATGSALGPMPKATTAASTQATRRDTAADGSDRTPPADQLGAAGRRGADHLPPVAGSGAVGGPVRLEEVPLLGGSADEPAELVGHVLGDPGDVVAEAPGAGQVERRPHDAR